ncbi:MAG: oppC 2 [Ramlibacter sp.]|nr:oppC 2 [Ramlibacter sp.]
MATETEAILRPKPRIGWLARWRQTDLGWSFTHSPRAMVSFALVLLLVLGSLLAPWISPQNPLDLASLDLSAALLPPAWIDGGSIVYPLGTDGQGRDLLSAILYGMRTSLLVGVSAAAFAMLVGVTLGLLAGYIGGFVDMVVMRLADIQWSFPAILIALLIDGIARNMLPRQKQEEIAVYVLVLAIGVSGWVQFARTVRGSTLVEKSKEYVQAARVTGVHPLRIMFSHVLPNTLGPVLVIATIYLAVAIIVEATLSFLGVGVPATQPSLGTLIRIGSNMLMSGEWWVTLFPSIVLATLVLSVNVLGDWLRDTLNPRLKT